MAEPGEIEEIDEILSIEQDILERLHFFFGYVEPLPDSPLLEHEAALASHSEDVPHKSQVTFMRLLGRPFTPGVQGYLNTPQSQVLWNFVRKFTWSKAPERFGECFDLDPSCRFYLRTSPMAKHLVTVEIPSRLHIPCARQLIPSKLLYAMNVNIASSPFMVAVDCPIIALAAIRALTERTSPDNETELLTAFLYTHGCHFYTLRRTPTSLTNILCPNQGPPLLEYASDYVFTLKDYEEYRARLVRLLSQPRMRAAGMQGGYIWRLVKDLVPLDRILPGPQDDTAEVLISEPEPGKDGQHSFIDDTLSRHDMHLIVGSYLVPDARSGKRVIKSWWPPPDADEDVGEFSGMWTPYLEETFRERLEAIMSGSAQPLRAREWKRDSKGWRGLRVWRKRLRELSTNFIRDLP